ncbi:MAG: hypothetical protein AB8B50_07045 [Pirellulaceae bacterium]
MSINVTCPSCLKRFQVSDKFAGKSGPCPNCKKKIQIPELSEQVVIHAPEDAGPKDSAGKAILKPIRRTETKIGTPVLVSAIVGAIAVVAIAAGLGLSGQQPQTWLLILGSLLLAPPLVFLGYWFLRDDELEGFTGSQLTARCGICSIGFAALWAIYGFVPQYVSGYSSMEEYSGLDMVIFFPVMLILGAFLAVLVLDLEIAQGAMNYSLYLGATFLLAWLAGAHLSEPLSGGGSQSTPAVPSTDSESEEPEERPIIPNLLN